MSRPVWEQYLDSDTQNLYYYNRIDQSTQWEMPVNRYGDPIPYVPHKNILSMKAKKEDHYEQDILVVPTVDIESQFPHKVAHSRSMDDYPKSRENKDNINLRSRSEFGLKLARYEVERHDRDRDSNINADAAVSYIDDSGCLDEENDRPISRDYIGMSRIYKAETVYRVKKGEVKCVVCFRGICRDVFFPCEHMCCCRSCLTQEAIAAESQDANSTDFCFCPLCNSLIKKIIAFDNGKEIDKYWSWVYETTPKLPTDFMKGFKHSAAVIQKVYIDENESYTKKPQRLKRDDSTSCSIG